MPVTEIRLPDGGTARLVYLRDWNNLGDMIYLQGARSGRMKEDSDAAQVYRAMAGMHALRLEAAVRAAIAGFDAVVSPPSSRKDSDVYRQTIVAAAGVPDLSAGFSRKGAVRAATAKSWEEVRDAVAYKPNGSEKAIKHLLIVDESVASGGTIASALHHLHKAGLPAECEITVAAAAWLKA